MKTQYNITIPIPITVSICVHVEIQTENYRQLTRVCTLHYKRLQCVHIPIISLTRDQCQVRKLLFEIDIYDGAFRYGSRVFNHAVGDSSSVDISDRLCRVGISATTMGHENTARHARKLCPGRRTDVQARWTGISRRTEGSQAMGNPK